MKAYMPPFISTHLSLVKLGLHIVVSGGCRNGAASPAV